MTMRSLDLVRHGRKTNSSVMFVLPNPDLLEATTKDFVIGTIDHKHMPVVSLENLSNFGKARQGQLLAFATDIYFDEVGNRTVAIKLNPKRGFLCFFRQGENLVPERAGFPRSRQAVDQTNLTSIDDTVAKVTQFDEVLATKESERLISISQTGSAELFNLDEQSPSLAIYSPLFVVVVAVF